MATASATDSFGPFKNELNWFSADFFSGVTARLTSSHILQAISIFTDQMTVFYKEIHENKNNFADSILLGLLSLSSALFHFLFLSFAPRFLTCVVLNRLNVSHQHQQRIYLR